MICPKCNKTYDDKINICPECGTELIEESEFTKELDDKTAEFQYDKGWYIITDIVGEEKNQVYKSKNAQEAYTKWNVYIGRKKERPQRVDKNMEKDLTENTQDY